VVAVAAALSALGGNAFTGAKSAAHKGTCQANLKQLGAALKMYALDNNGKLLTALFYPGARAKTDPKSLRKQLSSYVKAENVFLCPGAPSSLNKNGLSYLWNDSLNGAPLKRIPNASSTWMLVDAAAAAKALDSKTAAAKKIKPIPPAHVDGYNILYADGHVAWSKTPPKIAVK
jgi:prepilin-type processing-associated H-X9-DG protein